MHNFSQLLVIHYHFKKGGVTDVVFRAQSALCLPNMAISAKKDTIFSDLSIILACGEAFTLPKPPKTQKSLSNSNSSPSIVSKIIPSLGYCTSKSAYKQQEIQDFFEIYTNKQTLWWVHNHHLGKNPFFTRDLMAHLNKSKQPCILEMHDFPESARLDNLRSLQKTVPLPATYSRSKNTVFSVINFNDKKLLSASGLQASIIPNIIPFPSTVLLPNKKAQQKTKKTISAFEINKAKHHKALSSKNAKNNYVLFTYPVRCIRRKNVLESAVLSKMYEYSSNTPTKLAITLCGHSEQEKPYSNAVHQLYKQGYIKGFFGIGETQKNTLPSFVDICKASDLIISSSVQEGFGFTYIGAVSWARPLLARTVSVTADNKQALNSWYAHWYKKLAVPFDALDKKDVQSMQKQYQKKIDSVYDYYNSLSYMGNTAKKIRSQIQDELHSLMQGSVIDFSMLSVEVQIKLIKNMSTDKNLTHLLCQKNKNVLNKTQDLVHTKIKKPTLVEVQKNVDRYFSESSFVNAMTNIVSNGMGKRQLYKKDKNPHTIAKSMLNAHAQLSLFRLLFNPYNEPL